MFYCALYDSSFFFITLLKFLFDGFYEEDIRICDLQIKKIKIFA